MFNHEPGFRKESHFSHYGVLRHTTGKLVVCELPLSCVLPIVDNQKILKRTMAMARAYAQSIRDNLHLSAIYQSLARPRLSSYFKAARDYFTPPEITGIETRRYKGVPGQKIRIKAEDDVMVTAVEICIYDGAGRLLEGGRAVIKGRKPVWEYTARERNPALTGSSIMVSASDMPGNVTCKIVSV